MEDDKVSIEKAKLSHALSLKILDFCEKESQDAEVIFVALCGAAANMGKALEFPLSSAIWAMSTFYEE